MKILRGNDFPGSFIFYVLTINDICSLSYGLIYIIHLNRFHTDRGLQCLFHGKFRFHLRCYIYKHMQARLVRGSSFVHDTFGQYKTVEEFWDGEI